MQDGVETYEDAELRLSSQVKMGKDLQKLLEMDEFTSVFEEAFIKSFAVTNAYNFVQYDEATRKRYAEKLIGRSVFTQFINDVLLQGNMAVEELAELRGLREDDSEDDSKEHN